ncbi:hypothetical protein BDV93DRAFT_528579 [Ceratobasidium sp. AG-I]|nr:hypothetical protein BDV93DRAFT_528579 [Ceratobasidium sp. AG-I]
MQLYETKPDSAVFFRVFDGHGLGYSAKVELACSSLAPASANESFVIHWATEFKQEHSEQETKKRLFRPLVSGLYQRRAFGFPDHYVFGTAHHSTTTLEAFAATWEMPAKRKAPESDSTVYSKAPSACTGHWICFNFIC